MNRLLRFLLCLIFMGSGVSLYHTAIAASFGGEGWKAGVSKTDITPYENMWMAGFAVRDKPSEGKMHALWAKAVVLEDRTGNRCVLVSTDLLGFTKEIAENIKSEIKRKLGLSKGQILLNSSHTHSGPVLRDALVDIYPFGKEDSVKVDEYSKWLENKIIALVVDAASSLEEVTVESGIGVTRFQVNRRNNSAAHLAQLHELKGPNDHAVPVIRIKDASGGLKVLLFGYACHPTVLDGYEWSGDYPGFAQLELEKLYPGSVAMFFQGAGGDQNPLPRHSRPLARQYGKELAAAVERVLEEDTMRELAPEIQTAYQEVPLPLAAAPTEAALLEMIDQNRDGTYFRRWALRTLERLRNGESLETTYPYPIQAWTLGDQLIMGLGGELVVSYALKLKELFGWETFVLAYCNDVMGYIPSNVILKEGGYEGDTSQKVYGLPAKWNPALEDVIYEACKKLVEEIKPTLNL